MRYINVTLIDSTGSPTTTQIMSTLDGCHDALVWLEGRLFTDRNRVTYIAAFLFDTRTQIMLQYSIDGMRARLVPRGV